MKNSAWLAEATEQLVTAGVGTARLDALVLLEDVTGKNRTHLLAHPELELTHEQQNTLQKLLKRRIGHEPLAYIRGKTEFYGREFHINHDVLEPRPESETMIDLLKTSFPGLNPGKHLRVVDVGTGSGALAVTAKLEMPEAEVTAIDIDPKCLKVAQKNAKNHTVDITFVQSNLLESLPLTPYPLPLYILANLPYVPNNYSVNEAAAWEPKHAIFGGPDGLDLYRTLFKQLAALPNVPITVFTESLPFQHAELANITVAQNFTQIAQEDFIQVFATKL